MYTRILNIAALVIVCCFIQQIHTYTMIEIPSDGSSFVTRYCNTSWNYTDGFKTFMKVPGQEATSTSFCFCILYHPENQQLLDNLQISVETHNANDGNLWIPWLNISKSDWQGQNYTVPRFYVNNDSKLCINGTCRLPAIRINFLSTDEQETYYQHDLYLTCSPTEYVLPAVIYNFDDHTTPNPSTQKEETTVAQGTDDVTHADTTPPILVNTSEATSTQNTSKSSESDDSLLIIAAAVGSVGALILILILTIIIIACCCMKRKHTPQKRTYSTKYYDEVNHNEIEIHETSNGSIAVVGADLPNRAKEYSYANDAYQEEATIDPYGRSYTQHEAMNTDHIQYAEIDIHSNQNRPQPSISETTGAKDNALHYAELDMHKSKNKSLMSAQQDLPNHMSTFSADVPSTSYQTSHIRSTPVYENSNKIRSENKPVQQTEHQIIHAYANPENMEAIYAKPNKAKR